MKLGSLFDGSGGFPLAGTLCGIEPVWASEVEPYPIAVTRSRFPKMKHLGDISKINGAEIEPVDIITFGSPCQDLSVAGKRAGLKHEDNGDEETTRSGLFMEAVRIIKEMRNATNGEYPSFALWENVPGAFSSNKGEDFRIVLEELVKITEPSAVMPSVPQNGWPYADSYRGDGWSLAYRVFDAQYWGVPQRRRRIYLVADFRGECAREVLFEREGLRGYFATGGTPWQGVADHAEGSVGADDREGNRVINLNNGDVQSKAVLDPAGIAPALYAGECRGGGGECYVLDTAVGLDGYNATTTGDVSATLGVNCGTSTGRNGVITFEPGIASREGGHIYEGVAGTLRANAGDNQLAVCVKTWDARGNGDGEIANTITGDHENRITDYTSVVVALEGNGARPSHFGCGYSEDDTMYTLNTVDRHSVAYATYWDGSQVVGTLTANNAGGSQRMPDKENFNDRAAFNQGQNAQYEPQFYTDGTASTIVARGPSAVAYVDTTHADDVVRLDDTVAPLQARDYKGGKLVQIRYIVRRLTPTECARLQGFADRWGDIEEKTDFTDEEYRFWLDVRNTHAAINGKVVKEYTKEQMVKWYNKLHTDSAEYKMWGNGIALPPALYCMQGITEAVGA